MFDVKTTQNIFVDETNMSVENSGCSFFMLIYLLILTSLLKSVSFSVLRFLQVLLFLVISLTAALITRHSSLALIIWTRMPIIAC